MRRGLMRRWLPRRPPRLFEVAAVVALMAVVTLVVGRGGDSDVPGRSAAVSVATDVPSRQPLVSFFVYIGCGQSAIEVLRDGAHADMPLTVFDHQPFELLVRDSMQTGQRVTVQYGHDGRLYVLSGEGRFVGGYLSVGTPLVPVCT